MNYWIVFLWITDIVTRNSVENKFVYSIHTSHQWNLRHDYYSNSSLSQKSIISILLMIPRIKLHVINSLQCYVGPNSLSSWFYWNYDTITKKNRNSKTLQDPSILPLIDLSNTSSHALANRYFYYVSSNEGIMSHLQQLEYVWKAAYHTNRTIYMIGFQSKHYPDLPIVHMCDLFNLPPNIICLRDTNNLTILSTHKCIYTGANHPPEFYGWEKYVTNYTYYFNYHTIDCVAGPTSPQAGKYLKRNSTINNLVETVSTSSSLSFLNYYPSIHNKYHQLLPLIKEALGIDSNSTNYITVHWRRGDQLKVRCGKLDNSSNCDSEKIFVETLQHDIQKYVPKSELPMITYIATNEKDPKRLNYLKNHHYKVYFNIKKGLSTIREFTKESIQSQQQQLSTLDIFMIELLLMCDSKYFFSWGVSSVNTYLFHYCRGLNDPNNQIQITVSDSLLYNITSHSVVIPSSSSSRI